MLVINKKLESILPEQLEKYYRLRRLPPGPTILNYISYGSSFPGLKLKPGEDMCQRRTRDIRLIIIHTTKGIYPTQVLPGIGPDTKLEERISRLWSTDKRHAGAHLSVDWDGSICCHADLLDDCAYHAPPCNDPSIGIEMYQGNMGMLYEYQISVTVSLVLWLCYRFGIQTQCPSPSDRGEISRLKQGRRNIVGVFGHRHVGGRGPGDPGDDIFRALIENGGFAAYDFYNFEDMNKWRGYQNKLGVTADGVPGPVTCDAIYCKFPETCPGGVLRGFND